jgi:tRNA-specific 2-thiouridylase
MSGGVDSSVAAAILARQGHEVIGVTMELGQGPAGDPPGPTDPAARGGLSSVETARRVADVLGIQHTTVNYQGVFREEVIDPFVEEYLAGRTPIPCVTCNRVLKFGLLLRHARSLNARGVATGHYARIGHCADGRASLFRACDRGKDQSYFLFGLASESLAECRFPVGEMSKNQVRGMARSLGLPTADRPESQGVCFLPDTRIQAALRRLRPDLPQEPGPIVDGEERLLGFHPGAIGYTLGQRKGLGLADGPWYVSGVEPERNRVVVDRRPLLERRELTVGGVRWFDKEAPSAPVRVQIRHKSPSAPARVVPSNGKIRVLLDHSVWAPASGQAAAIYDEADSRMLGGGWILGSR